MIHIYCDGSSSNDNGGQSYAKWAIECNGNTFTTVGYGTNNQAEYKALILALDYAYQHKRVGPFTVYTDSTLVYYQMCGEWKIINDDIRSLHSIATRLRKCIDESGTYIILKLVGRKDMMQAHILTTKSDDDYLYSGIENIVEKLKDESNIPEEDTSINKIDGLPHDLNELEGR